MQPQAAARPRIPYGLAFQVPELEYVRSWAERQGLRMAVLLDQVLDGAEFEELLMISAPCRPRQALTLWRTDHAIIAQQAGGHPKGFASVNLALAQYAGAVATPLSKKRVRTGWKRLLARF